MQENTLLREQLKHKQIVYDAAGKSSIIAGDPYTSLSLSLKTKEFIIEEDQEAQNTHQMINREAITSPLAHTCFSQVNMSSAADKSLPLNVSKTFQDTFEKEYFRLKEAVKEKELELKHLERRNQDL